MVGDGGVVSGQVASPSTVWLASYPKSGNTWVRAIVTALGVHPHLFHVDQLSSGAQPFGLVAAGSLYGLDPRWLDQSELGVLRNALIRIADDRADRSEERTGPEGVSAPYLRKTHEVRRAGEGVTEPFPVEATRAAILVVRDPRDVACSFAPFFGVDLDGAVEGMGSDRGNVEGSPVLSRTAQPWGTWSTHTLSWLSPDVPFPVHLVRYEDLKVDAVATLGPVFDAIGMGCTRDELAAAVDRVRFDRLADAEAERGFRETSVKTDRFFRRGVSGGWRDELTDDQVAAIEADHAEVMERLGYELVTDDAARAALAESRASRRRRGDRPWDELPASLGIEVARGTVPDELEGAERPRPWLQTTDRATRVQFANGNALLVEDGGRVTLQWELADDDPDADLSWLVQGWSVTLSAMQRGQLSLHASTVRIGDEVVAIAGHQGAGKSTTSMAMRGRGHQLLIDDTTIIEFRNDEAWTTPYPRNVHLLPDAAAALGVDFDALPPLAGRMGKVAFLAEAPPDEPMRIDRIVVLVPRDDVDGVEVTEVRGAQRVLALRQHVSRRGLAPVILGPQRYFTQLAQLAGATRVQVLTRPREAWTLDEVLDTIESGAGESGAGQAGAGESGAAEGAVTA